MEAAQEASANANYDVERAWRRSSKAAALPARPKPIPIKRTDASKQRFEASDTAIPSRSGGADTAGFAKMAVLLEGYQQWKTRSADLFFFFTAS